RNPEAALRQVQSLFRRARPSGADSTGFVMSRGIGRPDGSIHILVRRDERDAVDQATKLLESDLRFEHLKKPEDEVWKFIGDCLADRTTNHVPLFVGRCEREVSSVECLLVVEDLTVESRTNVGAMTLIPSTDPIALGELADLALPRDWCAALVVVRGTNSSRISERARMAVEKGLSALRAVYRRRIQDGQLRFRLNAHMAFVGIGFGFHMPPNTAWGLNISSFSVDPEDVSLFDLAIKEPACDLERALQSALEWMDRATFAGDPVVEVLFLCFALESLLGDKSDGLKAYNLAIRQALLSHLVNGHFPLPNRTLAIYEDVRSSAVHGGVVDGVTPELARKFQWSTVETIRDFVKYAETTGARKVSRLVRSLDESPDRALLLDWIREHGGEDWKSFFAQLRQS
ncbi:hypothetical protein, partial [Kineosporia sp. A_224]|uniref:hypothetical protein n=1 Tax=Kineosporia sp. A_224 TaxID=1962180 RepID=UPI001303FC97